MKKTLLALVAFAVAIGDNLLGRGSGDDLTSARRGGRND